MRHNGERRPEDIQAEIERTRGDMNATLTAIEQRLTPGQLIDQSMDYLRHSGGREFVSNLGNSVKNNPIPVALMGIGMAWLMAGGSRKPSYAYPQTEGEGVTATKERLAEGISSTRERLSGGMASTRERLSQTGQAARERMGHWGESARGQMERMRSQAERLRGGYDSMVREQPLVLGAIGLAVGALLAAAAPRTRQEDQLMGEASDRLGERVKEAGKAQLEKAKEVAATAKEAAVGEARKQGMTPKSDQPAARTQPAGRPNVVEPARATPATEAKPKDPRLGTP